MKALYSRAMQPKLQELSGKYPFVTITGPRQSGKSTLATMTFPDFKRVSLEDLDMRQFAYDDPRGFLKTFSSNTIIDEVQRVPSILSYLQSHTDNNSEARYILTGSQNADLMKAIDQSLAGRTGILELLPLSQKEMQNAGIDTEEVNEEIYKGGYPRLYYSDIEPTDFYPAYIRTYVERDLRQIMAVGDLNKFVKFIKLCAGRIGQLVNKTSLATEAGVSSGTIDSWLSVLQSSYIIYMLQPYYENFSKRQVKTPKLYFYDTGLACSLLEISDASQLSSHFLRGGLFENLVINERIKHWYNQGRNPAIYFWRDSSGNEVHMIDATSGKPEAYEIKSGQTFNKEYLKGLKVWSKISGAESENSHVIYCGDIALSTSEGNVIPWHTL